MREIIKTKVEKLFSVQEFQSRLDVQAVLLACSFVRSPLVCLLRGKNRRNFSSNPEEAFGMMWKKLQISVKLEF